MSIQIVPAEREHAFVCAALTVQADLEDGGERRDGFLTEYADAWLADFERTPTWLAFADDGTAVGLVVTSWVKKLPSLTRPTVGWLHVKLVFVSPAYRGKGTAERMLKTMLRWGDEHAITRYQLNAEPKARTLYERLGFGPADERLMQLQR
ncbi:GNAT family N-acetyltransferase [Calidifontibacter sp. DB0510]|uniref:GNAT family N-acetyltransferase n=1 Tax=Metallococcus carri TaxID=1656884 RepID=A0A967B2S6_9MICO|nr:GNAT family N-acetyltransferase [Metallococcus carri]NHN56962.1 GNAT family N-acetyltransferase [Metallococcus carri]NOP37707.1 GNAT family N-acetyltransferase [Calidifontibacter sp. DB2511S]